MRCKARKKFEPQQPFGCEDSNYRSATKQIAHAKIQNSNKRMRCKARKKFEPQQPFGCEDSNYRSATKQLASYLDFEAMV